MYVLESAKREITPLQEVLPRQMKTVLQSKRQQLKQLESAFLSQDPKLKNKKGYAQVSKNGKVIELEVLEVGESFDVMTDKVSIVASVEKKSIL